MASETDHRDVEMHVVDGDAKMASQVSVISSTFRAASDGAQYAKLRPERKDWHFKLYKTPKEATIALAVAGEAKAKVPFDKTFLLGILGGLYIALAGLVTEVVAYGMPNSDPGVQKGIYGLIFPVGLCLIIFTGGDLYTGNTMYMSAALCFRRIKIWHLLVNWFFSWFGNLAGCILFAYLFGYLTDLFVAEPWLHKIQAIAVTKTSLPWKSIFFSAMAANILVCLSVLMSVASEDIASKTIVMYIGVAAFATCGFEHAIANMYYLTISLLYGAPITVNQIIYDNLIPVTVGNTIGGCFVSITHWFLYGYRQDIEGQQQAPANPLRLTYITPKDKSAPPPEFNFQRRESTRMLNHGPSARNVKLP